MVRGISGLYRSVLRLTIIRSRIVGLGTVGGWGGGYSMDYRGSVDRGVGGGRGVVWSGSRGIGSRGRVVGSRCRVVRCGMVGMMHRCMMKGVVTISFFPWVETYFGNSDGVTWN